MVKIGFIFNHILSFVVEVSSPENLPLLVGDADRNCYKYNITYFHFLPKIQAWVL